VGLLTTSLLARAIWQGRRKQVTGSMHAAERSELYGRHDRRHEIGASRGRWLHEHAALASFPCGVIRPTADPDEAEADDPPLPVGTDLELTITAALLNDEVAFLADPPEETDLREVIPVGRVRRSAIRAIDVVDAAGAPVPAPAAEGFEPDEDVWLVLRWGDGDDANDERFLFRSAWLAWGAARRLEAFAASL
jgi:hypothetical protein